MTSSARVNIDRYLDALTELVVGPADSCQGGESASREAVVAGVASSIGAAVDPELASRLSELVVADLPEVPTLSKDLDGADLIGLAVQAITGAQDRHAEGMYFTPRGVAEGIADIALTAAQADAAPKLILDPSCGGGAFLLAAARWLEERGVSRADAVSRLRGVDLDPVAAAAARTALGIWGSVPPEEVMVVSGDGFFAEVVLPVGGRIGVVIGNPPFQNQMGETTARTAAQSQALRERFDGIEGAVHSGAEIVRPYVDTAALFLLDAVDRVAEGGVVMMILPQSVLATKDVAPIRETVASIASLEALWITDDAGFDASVRVCAPLLRKGAPQAEVTTYEGAEPEIHSTVAAPSPPSRWSEYAADRLGVPRVTAEAFGEAGALTVADIATATAGFRDEYYGLAAAAEEAPDDVSDEAVGDTLRLITSGLIEPLQCDWGVEPCRFAKQRWQRLSVDRDALAENERIARWVTARQVPKLLVATQTKVIEAMVDADGTCIPVTPVISVEPVQSDQLWLLAAALTNPVTSAIALRRTAGAALASHAIKMSAKQVLALPLPSNADSWSRGANIAKELAKTSSETAPSVREVQFVELGILMCDAYGVPSVGLLDWWADRLGISGPVVASTVSRAKMDEDG